MPPIIDVIDKRSWRTACSLTEWRLPSQDERSGHQRNSVRLALGGCCFRPVSEPAYASGRRHMSVPIYGRVCSCQQRFIRWLSHPI